MPPIPATDPARVWQCRLNFTSGEFGSQPTWSTGFHVVDETATPLTPGSVVAALDTAVTTWFTVVASTLAVRSHIANSVTLDHILVSQPLVTPEPVGLIGTIASPGTLTDDALPAELAVVISLRTDTKGQSHRGRMYMGGFTEAANAAGLVDTAVTGNLDFATERLRNDLIAADLPMVVLSRFSGGAERAIPVYTEVLSASVDRNWDSQRRRGLR